MTESSPLFALDIGTRSVVGLLLHEKNEKYELIDTAILEHDERAMHDGQIHDVPSVAATIRAVKEQLESRNGPLHKVCVAAAGRSLKTRRAEIEIDITEKPLFSKEDVLHLELSAVQQAQFELASSEDTNVHYYCVGYSVLNYFLDGERIGSLIDQTGKKAKVQVIATFLPSVVIESLTAALTRAGLELEALTLEPIAAIHVLIPPTMRRLNVALVDIGAGTSDIAITDEQTVIGYGMVPMAGDEITEALSDHFLLDFPEADKVKRKIATEETVTITDILGIEATYSKEEIIAPLTDSVRKLAQFISDEILSINGKPPKAVMLIGGGSLTPNLDKEIARFLQLPENRVAIRDGNAIQLLQKEENDDFGPELVTPIGIAIAAKDYAIQSIRITVNKQPVRLFEVKKLTVGDGLLAAGIHLSKLYGKPGLALMVTINDRLVSVPGEHGKPPTIRKNGEIVSLEDPIKSDDDITVEKGTDGNKRIVTIEQLIETAPTTTVTFNGKPVELELTIIKNGEKVRPDAVVEDRDVITIEKTTVRHLCIKENISPTIFEPFHLYINGEKSLFPGAMPRITINGKTATIHSPLQHGDVVHIDQVRDGDNHCTVEQLLQSKEIASTTSITVFFNRERVTLEKEIVDVFRGDEQLNRDSFVFPNDQLTIKRKKEEPFILQDIFAVVDIDLKNYTGKKIVITKNEEEANFADVIVSGDNIELYLE